MKFILGSKMGMTQVFKEDGTVAPVTRVQAGPCVITQLKTKEQNGHEAVQIGFGKQKLFRVTKPLKGHLAGIGDNETTVRFLRDFKIDEQNKDLKKGDEFTVKNFVVGEKVQVVGTSKGKGFQGVVKRHGFHGGKKTHGGKDQERMPGSIGAGGVQRVFKGLRMGGHMGVDRITVKNLEIIEVHPETNELWIKGAMPGSRGGLLLISSFKGKMEVEKMAEANQPEEKPEVAEVVEAPAVAEIPVVTEAPVTEVPATPEVQKTEN